MDNLIIYTLVAFHLPRRLILLFSLAVLSHYHKNQPHFVACWLCGISSRIRSDDENSAK